MEFSSYATINKVNTTTVYELPDHPSYLYVKTVKPHGGANLTLGVMI